MFMDNVGLLLGDAFVLVLAVIGLIYLITHPVWLVVLLLVLILLK